MVTNSFYSTKKQAGQRIRVLLADDHRIVRETLSHLLQREADLEVVGEAENGQQALDLARECSPDVIVMDVNMPVMNGTKATRILTKEMPKVKVIALSMHVEEETVTGILEAGASAYLIKGISAEDLMEAIRACYAKPPKDSHGSPA